MSCGRVWDDSATPLTCTYSVAIRVNRVMLVSLWTETMKFVEGNASVYQVKSLSPISGEGRVCVWGGGELQQRDL